MKSRAVDLFINIERRNMITFLNPRYDPATQVCTMAKIRTIEDFKINNEAAGKVFEKGFFLVDFQ